MLESLSIGGRRVPGFGFGAGPVTVPACSTWTATIRRGNTNDVAPIMPPGFTLTASKPTDASHLAISGAYSGPSDTSFPTTFNDTNGGPFWYVETASATPIAATWNGSACIMGRPAGGVYVPPRALPTPVATPSPAPSPSPAASSSSSSKTIWLVLGGAGALATLGYLALR